MTSKIGLAGDVVIVGGGISGLSIAALLSRHGIAVTLLEASELGTQASTSNQGWLYSGAWFAPRQTALAKMCHNAFEETLRFCPDCLEPGHSGMMFGMTDQSDIQHWTDAWTRAEIPWQPLAPNRLRAAMPDSMVRFSDVFQLPDRAIRPQILLKRLADSALEYGARIHTGVRVSQLNCNDGAVRSVTTATGDEICASLVILATGASEADLSRYLTQPAQCSQSLYTRVTLQSHLLSVPQLATQPVCLPDFEGFNHIPHMNQQRKRVSVFGVDRWRPLPALQSHPSSDEEFCVIREHIARFFPNADFSTEAMCCWSGTTVQAMCVDQIEPGLVPLPVVIDHADECPEVSNLLSVYPGRATLWNQLAEDTANIVLRRLKPTCSQTAIPPWA